MRFVVTYCDANKQNRIRFFKTLVEAKDFINFMRSFGSGSFSEFKIKVIKPY